MKRSRGYLSKTLKGLKTKRRLTPADFVREFQIGEKVRIDPVPYYKQGQIPHRHYKNMTGEILEKRGRCYVVKVEIGSVARKLILLPIHLKRL